MGQKYFAWSFDDGLEQDERIIEVLRKYGMGATFHLNSGMMGERTQILRVSTLGFLNVPEEKFNAQKRHFFPHVNANRLPVEKVRNLYMDFEVASHTAKHLPLPLLPPWKQKAEIVGDIQALSELFNREIKTFAYPFGLNNKATRKQLAKAGIQYARTVSVRDTFDYPEDTLDIGMNGWQVQKDVFEKLDRFYEADSSKDQFFLMFTHGYELDFGVKESNWDKFEKICKEVSSHKDIICCSIGDALDAMNHFKQEG